MIEESGRVVAVKNDRVWVETIRQSACSGCSARSGCGHGLMSKISEGKRNHIQVQTDAVVQVGDQVVLGIPDHAVMRSSLWAYGMPLFVLILAVVLADTVFGLAEPWVIASAGAGLAAGFGLVRLHALLTRNHSDYQPVIVRTLPDSQAL